MRRGRHLLAEFFLKALLLSICPILSCEESLPPRDLKDFLEPVFRGGDVGEVYFSRIGNDTVMFGSGAAFSVGLKNKSDDYLQAKASIHGTIEITSPTDPTFHRAYDFTVPQLNEVTISPQSEFTVSVPWDQRNESCQFVFRNIPLERVTIGRNEWFHTTSARTFRAKGKVQFWPNVQTKELPEITFQRTYYFIEELGNSFPQAVTCSQFAITP